MYLFENTVFVKEIHRAILFLLICEEKSLIFSKLCFKLLLKSERVPFFHIQLNIFIFEI